MPSQEDKPSIHSRVKKLRSNQTTIEAQLWFYLRSHRFKDVHFRRQHPIGDYIVDFCAPKVKLVIELDGSQHMEAGIYDLKRTAFLQSRGYRVLRFWNSEVSNHLEDVLQAIDHALNGQRKD